MHGRRSHLKFHNINEIRFACKQESIREYVVLWKTYFSHLDIPEMTFRKRKTMFHYIHFLFLFYFFPFVVLTELYFLYCQCEASQNVSWIKIDPHKKEKQKKTKKKMRRLRDNRKCIYGNANEQFDLNISFISFRIENSGIFLLFFLCRGYTIHRRAR